MKASEIEEKEPRLLDEARGQCPKLYFETLDALVIDEIGKDISGSGFDTNVVGKVTIPRGSAADRESPGSSSWTSPRSRKATGNGLGMAELYDFFGRRRSSISPKTYPKHADRDPSRAG